MNKVIVLFVCKVLSHKFDRFKFCLKPSKNDLKSYQSLFDNLKLCTERKEEIIKEMINYKPVGKLSLTSTLIFIALLNGIKVLEADLSIPITETSTIIVRIHHEPYKFDTKKIIANKFSVWNQKYIMFYYYFFIIIYY